MRLADRFPGNRDAVRRSRKNYSNPARGRPNCSKDGAVHGGLRMPRRTDEVFEDQFLASLYDHFTTWGADDDFYLQLAPRDWRTCA